MCLAHVQALAAALELPEHLPTFTPRASAVGSEIGSPTSSRSRPPEPHAHAEGNFAAARADQVDRGRIVRDVREDETPLRIGDGLAHARRAASGSA